MYHADSADQFPGAVALAIQALKRDRLDRMPRYLLGGALTGLMFMVSKAIEYFQSSPKA
jgi:nitric oxide reductase NorE protein